MLTRYDLIFFNEFTNPDDIAQLYPVDHGRWVRADEAENAIIALKEALSNLKKCNVHMNTPEELNRYVDAVLGALK